MSEADDMEGAPARGPIAAFVRNPVAANLLMVALIAGGLLALLRLPMQALPEFDPRQVAVSVTFPGASAMEVQRAITSRVEEALIPIDGIDRVRSTASTGFGVVTAEVAGLASVEEVQGAVQGAVASLASFPPAGAERPEVERVRPRREGVVLGLSGDVGERELLRAASDLRDRLLSLTSTTDVQLVGGREQEVAIEVSQATLRANNLATSDIADAVRDASASVTSARLRADGGDILIGALGVPLQVDGFEDIRINANLRLGDIATIRDGFADVGVASRWNGRPALWLRTSGAAGTRVGDMVEDMQDALAEYTPPKGIYLDVLFDESRQFRERMLLSITYGVAGLALIFLFLVAVFDLRMSVWITGGIVIAFVGSLPFLGVLGLGLNLVTLLAMIFVVGIVVDDALIVGESIATEREAMSADAEGAPSSRHAAEAAITGARSVRAPMVTGVVTTMLGFTPMLFLSGGIFGQMLSPIAIVVTVVLAVSLIEAFFILPAHLSHPRGWSLKPLSSVQAATGRFLATLRDDLVMPAIVWAVRRPGLTLLMSGGFLALAAAVLGTGLVRFVPLPADAQQPTLEAVVTFPAGTPYEVTLAAAERIVAAAEELNAQSGGKSFDGIMTTVGYSDSVSGALNDTNTQSHLAAVVVRLGPERTASRGQIVQAWRREVGSIPGVDSLTFELEASPAEVSYLLSHPDQQVLAQAAAEWKEAVARIPSAVDLRDSLALGGRQYDIELTPAGVAAGLTVGDVARQFRSRFSGVEVKRMMRGRDEVKVVVRYPADESSSLSSFLDESISVQGQTVRFGSLVRIVELREYDAYESVDGRRTVTVAATVDTDRSTPGLIDERIRNQVLPGIIARHPGLEVGVEGALLEAENVLVSLAVFGTAALLLIYAVIAIVLRSYWQPLIVLAGVPFAAAGAVFGHLLLNYDLTLVSAIGMVAVAGVVVNDTVILLHRYNQIARESDLPAVAALSAAVRQRFRPIFLTSVTTLVGVWPFLVAPSETTQFVLPMLVSLGTGLAFTNIGLLFFIPAAALIVELARDRWLDWRNPRRAVEVAA